LKQWNQKTNSKIHDADLPKTSTGKYFVIIPHADFNEETISFFKTIGVKGRLYDNVSKLEVKDEDELSGSSSSESGGKENVIKSIYFVLCNEYGYLSRAFDSHT